MASVRLSAIIASISATIVSSPTVSFPCDCSGHNCLPEDTLCKGLDIVSSLPDMYLKTWDVGGHMSLRRLWQSYYKSAHAVFFAVSSMDLGGDADLSRV
jgi:ADP-ribosylation factor family